MSFSCGRTFSDGSKCQYSSKRRCRLTDHAVAMHQSKPCPRCPELPDFPDRVALDNHRQTHGSWFPCNKPWCPASFLQARLLDTHVKKCKIPNIDMKCSKCQKSFKLFYSYQRHLIDVHSLSVDAAKALLKAEAPAPNDSDSETDDELNDADPPPPKKPKSTPEEPCLRKFEITDVPQSDDRMKLQYGRLSIVYGFGIRGPRVAHLSTLKGKIDTCVVKRTPGLIDKSIPFEWRAVPEEFVKFKDLPDGTRQQIIERSHLQPFKYMNDKDTSEAANLLCTMLPQLKSFNRYLYRYVEDFEGWLLSEDYKDLNTIYCQDYVKIDSFAGGIYVNDVGKRGRVPIASHFFNVVIAHLGDGEFDVWIFVMEHKEYPPGTGLQLFLKTYDELLALDRDNFIPRLDLADARNFNKNIWSEAAQTTTATSSN